MGFNLGDFLKDVIGGVIDKEGGDVSTSDIVKILGGLGTASYLKDRGTFETKVPVVGYQGKIPEYQAIQEQVTGRDDSDRRPGSGGRRYMSDVIYAKAPENQEPMSVAKAQAKAKAQAQGFAEGGDVTAFLQGLGGGEGGVGYQNLIQSMQPQGRAAPQRMQTAPVQPAPMPMPAPSGGMGGLDMLTLAALLQGQQGQQGGGAQPQQTQQTEDPAIDLKKEFTFGGGSGDKMPEPDYQVSEDGGIYDNTFYGVYDAPSVKYTRYDPETDTYYGTSTNYAFGGKETPITIKGSEAPQGLRDAFSAYERGELKYTPPEELADLIKKQQEDMQQSPPVAGGTGSIGGGGAPTLPQGEENIGLGGGIADAMKKMQEQAPKQMPTTDRVAGPPKGQRRRGQPVPSTGGKVKKGNVPVGRGTVPDDFFSPITKLKSADGSTAPATGTPAKRGTKLGSGNAPRQPAPSTGGRVKKGNIPVGRGVNDGAQYKDTPPRKAQPVPRRAPTPPMDYSKILESLGGIGGIGMAKGGYLNGNSDGQADKVPGSIDGVQEARLSHGEYVLPADLVSLLGNGNSDAGAKALDDFMAMVRKQGTGTEKQQKNIKADKVLASLMKGKG